MKKYLYKLIALEFSAISKYFEQLIHFLPLPHDNGGLFESAQCDSRLEIKTAEDLAQFDHNDSSYRLFLLNGNLNHATDIHGLLGSFRNHLGRNSRIAIVQFSPYLYWLYAALNWIGWRVGTLPNNILTRSAFDSLVRMADLELVRVIRTGIVLTGYLPLDLAINRMIGLLPIIREICPVNLMVLCAKGKSDKRSGLSVIIPVRDEQENLSIALKELAKLDSFVREVIFVEGHSRDGSWEEIQRLTPSFTKHFSLVSYKQEGKGKADAVRLGIGKASQELVVILDADLTVSPEYLKRFYDAWIDGHADFINGHRLLYPNEDGAMRFLNRVGNVFFAKLISFLLDANVNDTLCGTKLFSKKDYLRFVNWRNNFGDHDPFGDFELIFPAAQMGLRIADVPIPYKRRIYGSTKISRFRDGFRLLKMSIGYLFAQKR